MGPVREAEQPGPNGRTCSRAGGASLRPSRGQGQLGKQMRSTPWPVDFPSCSVEARKIQWDPSLPRFSLGWRGETTALAHGGVCRFSGASAGGEGDLTSSDPGERRSF